MRHQELSRQLQRIKSLFDRASDACGENIELRSDWAKYICVLSAGFLENGIKLIYSDYVHKTISQPIANYVETNLNQIRSPKAQRFYEIASAFKASWSADLQNFAELEGRGDAVDSIMRNRHLISHGNSNDSRITLVQIKDYLERSVEFLEFIEKQCAE